MLNQQLQQLITETVASVFPDHADKDVVIEYPNNPDHGDYSCNVALQLAKPVGKSPREVAQMVIDALDQPEWIRTVEIAGPGFINVFLHPEYLSGQLRHILASGDKYGSNAHGDGKKIMVEYSQPNTNKPMHIGHLRNNFVGMAVTRLLRANGYDVMPVNYVGDIGIHIAKSMLGYQKWGRETTPESTDTKGDYFVGKYYQKFEAELQENPELIEEAQDIVRKWEEGDEGTHALWNKMNQWVYDGWNSSYERQGCHFDKWYYESEFNESGKEVAEEALGKGVATRAENGAIIAQLDDHNMPNKVLVRGDGTSIYATKDLKLAEEAFAEFDLHGRVYVVASQQKVYLEQIFKILELLGYDYAQRCFHLAYGIVSLPEGMMSSRKGTVIYADDLMNDVHALAYNEVKSRNDDEDDDWIHNIAEHVMVAAVKYAILKVDPLQNITYDAKEAVRFEGDTGPYLMYTYARIRSILRKAASAADNLHLQAVEAGRLAEPEAMALLRKLQLYPEVVAHSGEHYRLHSIANYLHDLAQAANSFYVKHPVLDGPSDELKTARLQLLAAVAQVIHNGLDLLGIETVERM